MLDFHEVDLNINPKGGCINNILIYICVLKNTKKRKNKAKMMMIMRIRWGSLNKCSADNSDIFYMLKNRF